MTTKLSVIVFPGGFNLPLWASEHCGAFARRELEIDLHFTTNSVQQLFGLIRGEWDIGLTGFDNVVAYQEGQGEAEIDHEPDLFVFMGGDDAFLRLVVQPNVRSYADLKGKILSVDALTTGFAFVLRRMLALNGIAEADVNFERAGGVLQRFEALKQGKHAGTLLITPFDLIADKLGLRVLQKASDVLPHYQGVAGAARRAWAKENSQALVQFIGAYLEGLRWLYDRRNEAQACSLLAEKVPNMTPDLAKATYRVLVADQGGFDRSAALDLAGVKAVLELRSAYGHPRKLLTDVEKYHDLDYYQRAVSGS